jgi:hypothetical protein
MGKLAYVLATLLILSLFIYHEVCQPTYFSLAPFAGRGICIQGVGIVGQMNSVTGSFGLWMPIL